MFAFGMVAVISQRPVAYTGFHEPHSLWSPILEIVCMEPPISGVPTTAPGRPYRCLPEPCSCVLEATSISESSVEKFALVGTNPVVFLPGRHFYWCTVSSFDTKLFARQFEGKHCIRASWLAFAGVRCVLGLSNEGISLVRF